MHTPAAAATPEHQTLNHDSHDCISVYPKTYTRDAHVATLQSTVPSTHPDSRVCTLTNSHHLVAVSAAHGWCTIGKEQARGVGAGARSRGAVGGEGRRGRGGTSTMALHIRIQHRE